MFEAKVEEEIIFKNGEKFGIENASNNTVDFKI